MKVLLITSNYPGPDMPGEMTKVVHYFVREWPKLGTTINVIHAQTVFPSIEYPIIRLFRKTLYSKSGVSFPLKRVKDIDYVIDEIPVYRRTIFKMFPSIQFGQYSKKSLWKKTKKIVINGDYDVVVAHWDEPGLYILHKVKEEFGLKIVFILHGCPPVTDLNRKYLSEVDGIGYRSVAILKLFEKSFGITPPISFSCYSGIPEKYLADFENVKKDRNSILYVGGLIKRKNPDTIVRSLLSNSLSNMSLTLIGDGGLKDEIAHIINKYKLSDRIKLLGRLTREEIIKYMKKTDVFIMISSAETFGLVYIEAMSQGCITIASKGEGMDGIIEDSKNGFLCTAGDERELTTLLLKISKMSEVEKDEIRQGAISTARELTELNVSVSYLNSLKKIVNQNEKHQP